MIRGLFLWALAVVALGVSGPAAGANLASDVFMVRDVAVDATSTGAAQARDIAIAEGQDAAYRRMMERLIRQQDWQRIPDLSDSAISDLLIGYAVNDEHTSSTRYIAKVTYTFKPPAVRALLQQAGIPFSESRAKPALLIPLIDTANGTALWDDVNPWRDAWAKRDLIDDLVPILLPQGDAGDAALLAVAQAKAATWGDVSALARKYGVERVVIAYAMGQPQPTTVHLTQLSATASSVTAFDVAPNGDPSAQLDDAVATAIVHLEEAWKAQTIVSFDQQNALVASVWFGSLPEWLSVERQLAQVSTVTSYKVLALSSQGAEVQLNYAGTIDQLRLTLAQFSLTLADRGAYWQLGSTRSMAAAGIAPPTLPADSPAPAASDANAPSDPTSQP